MGRFEEFELPIRKVQDYPLVFEALIPNECSLFQDVRRYQSITSHLDVKTLNIDGKISLDQGMVRLPIAKLSKAEKQEFIEYLKLRVRRGDNIGSLWAFFRSEDKKKTLTALGANVVYKEPIVGQARSIRLLTQLQKSGVKTNLFINLLTALIVISVLSGAGYFAFQKFYVEKSFNLRNFMPTSDSVEMKFYKNVFPDVYSWKDSDVVDRQIIAKLLLNPDYISDLISCMSKDYYKDEGTQYDYKGTRLTLFTYFNYNEHVKKTIQKYKTKLEGTEFARLIKIYSCAESEYSSNVFYFKVGDLDIKPPEITSFLKQNMVSYNDYKRLRNAEEFSEMLKKDTINFKLKNFLADVYTFTPLKIEEPIDLVDWYLLTKKSIENNLEFAAFFKRGESTLLPKKFSKDLTSKTPQTAQYTWYTIDSNQEEELKLSDSSIMYFTQKIGQTFKLEIINKKIKELELEQINEFFPVAVHRELLMEDSKGKYGIQCYDPLTSLVLSNLISKTSFEETSKVTLKRDPIQVNTSLVQLSKDDSSSTQAINISPGKSDIVELFKNVDYFRGKLANGKKVKFEKADINLFNPFSFMVYSDSITFSYKHEISEMEFAIKKKVLKIIRSADGGHQIAEID